MRQLTPFMLLSILFLLACGGSEVPSPPPPPSFAPPPPSSVPSPPPAVELRLPPVGSDGIDVSHFSGQVDWRAVEEAGYHFVYVKATEGIDSKDPLFEDHWRALDATKLLRGAYHFYVTEDDPEAQARFFIETVAHLPVDLVPVVDVEILGHGTDTSTLAEDLRRFLDIVEGHFGAKPMIYTSPKFWNAHLDDTFGEHPLWVAEYGVEEPTIPAGWQGWHLWQYADSHAVPGVEKDADLSRARSGE